MPDRFSSFAELAAAFPQADSWRVKYEDRGSDTLIMAPHGGKIEPFTSQLARLLGDPDLSVYRFEGMLPVGNRDLHITSHRFDEPIAVKAVSTAEVVIAIHGAEGRNSFVMIGGRDEVLADAIRQQLEAVGFDVRECAAGMGATRSTNICNRGSRRMGVQIEVSKGAREAMQADTRLIRLFTQAVRKALSARADGLRLTG